MIHLVLFVHIFVEQLSEVSWCTNFFFFLFDMVLFKCFVRVHGYRFTNYFVFPICLFGELIIPYSFLSKVANIFSLLCIQFCVVDCALL